MLPAPHRLSASADFQQAVRRGRRSAQRTLVVHFLAPERVDGDPMSAEPPARFGFVVSKAVGGAVVRNRVKRRLRHACHGLVTDLPAGSVTVVRALPSAATAGFDQLAADLSSGIGKAKDRVG